MTDKGLYSDADLRRKEESAIRLDQAARAGLRFASALMLIAELISVVMEKGDEADISTQDLSVISSFLCPLSRAIYDQFARISARITHERRTTVVDLLNFPTTAIRESFINLIKPAADLFGGKFEETLVSEVKIQKEWRETEFLKPVPPSRRGNNRVFNRASNSQQRASSAPSSRGSFRSRGSSYPRRMGFPVSRRGSYSTDFSTSTSYVRGRGRGRSSNRPSSRGSSYTQQRGRSLSRGRLSGRP